MPQTPARDFSSMRSVPERPQGSLPIEDSGCYAVRDEEQIKVFNPEGNMIFSIATKAVSQYDAKGLMPFLQLYMIAFQTGRAAGQNEAKEKITELIRIAL